MEFQEVKITQLRFDGTKVQDGKELAFVMVQFQAKFAPNKQGAWGNGENTRFAQLMKENDAWKLAVLATSPPHL